MAENNSEADRIDQVQLKEVDKEAHGIAQALGGTTENKFQETIRGIQKYFDRIRKPKGPPATTPPDKK